MVFTGFPFEQIRNGTASNLVPAMLLGDFVSLVGINL